MNFPRFITGLDHSYLHTRLAFQVWLVLSIIQFLHHRTDSCSRSKIQRF